MIRNILFDMGNVLIHFDRKVFLDRLDITEEEKQLLMREVFLSVEWVQMDRGTLCEETAEPLMCQRLPEHLHSAVHCLASQWDEPMIPVAGMAELVEEYDQASGEPENREWVAWSYTLNLAVTQDAKFFTISNGSDIPLTVANEHAGATENTLYKAATGVGTPEDVSKILNQRYP